LDEYRIEYSLHATERMFQRKISKEEVALAFVFGEVIERYPDRKPHPKELILCWNERRPLHVVAINAKYKIKHVITVYEPNIDEWEDNFRRRKS